MIEDNPVSPFFNVRFNSYFYCDFDYPWLIKNTEEILFDVNTVTIDSLCKRNQKNICWSTPCRIIHITVITSDEQFVSSNNVAYSVSEIKITPDASTSRNTSSKVYFSKLTSPIFDTENNKLFWFPDSNVLKRKRNSPPYRIFSYKFKIPMNLKSMENSIWTHWIPEMQNDSPEWMIPLTVLFTGEDNPNSIKIIFENSRESFI